MEGKKTFLDPWLWGRLDMKMKTGDLLQEESRILIYAFHCGSLREQCTLFSCVVDAYAVEKH
jgi:hypothetical protein